MNAENPSMSKFQLVTATQIPHRCLACGRSSDGKIKFLDFGLSLDVEDPLFIGVPDSALGVIYICEDCGREAAALLGCLPPTLSQTLTEDLAAANGRVEKVEEENARLHRLIASYTDIVNHLGLPSPSDSSDSGDSETSESTDSEAGESVTK